VSAPDTEATDQGQQYVAPGIAPITIAQRLAGKWAAPMQPRSRAQQRPCNVGLFDEDARKQMDILP
jgi:hypothetical protein